jgi:hypothetical protein
VASLKRPAGFNAIFFVFIPSEVRKWTALLVECGEVCQYYFSIFETADYTGEADNEMRKARIRAFFRLLLLLVLDEDYGRANQIPLLALWNSGAEATSLYSSAACPTTAQLI